MGVLERQPLLHPQFPSSSHREGVEKQPAPTPTAWYLHLSAPWQWAAETLGVTEWICPTPGDTLETAYSSSCSSASHCPSHSLFLWNRGDNEIGASAYASCSLHRELCSVPSLPSRQACYMGIETLKGAGACRHRGELEAHLVCCADRNTLHV